MIENKFKSITDSLAELLSKKNKAYGNAFEQAKEFLKLLYPDGIRPDQYEDMLFIVRIFDKLKRIATSKNAFNESPYQDIAGYAILALAAENKDVYVTKTQDLFLTLKDVVFGKDVEIQIENEKVNINIPPGIQFGTEIRKKVEINGEKVLLVFNAKRDQNDECKYQVLNKGILFGILELDNDEAKNGCKKKIKLVDGSEKEIEIQPNTQDGSIIKIPNEGLPVSFLDSTRGSLILKVYIINNNS